MKEKVLIISDLEGIIGIENLYDDSTNELLLYKQASIAFDFYKTIMDADIYFCYCHNAGISPEIIRENYPKVTLIEHLWNIDFSVQYDFAILLGFHDKSGGIGLFPHSFRVEISKIILFQEVVGEIEIIIEFLRLNKVPTILVSADKDTIDTIDNQNLVKHIIIIGNLQGCEKSNEKSYSDLLICLKQSIELVNNKTFLYGNSLINPRIRLELKEKVDKLMLKFDIYIQKEFSDAEEFVEYLPFLAKKLNRLEGIRRELIIKEIKKYNYIDPSLIQKNYPRVYSILQNDVYYLSADQLAKILKIFQEMSNDKGSF